MSKATESFYKTSAWQNCRSSFLAKKKWLCEMCLSAGMYTPAEIAHHKIFITESNMYDPSITLNHDNLMAVCRKHHDEIHNKRKDMRYYFDEKGNLIMLE